MSKFLEILKKIKIKIVRILKSLKIKKSLKKN